MSTLAIPVVAEKKPRPRGQRANNNRRRGARKSPAGSGSAPHRGRRPGKGKEEADGFGPHSNSIPLNYVQKATSGYTGSAKKAILAIALPERSMNFRWSSPFSEQSTAAARPWSRAPVGFAGAVAPTNPPCPASDNFSILRRIPQAAIICYEANSANTSYSYNWNIFALNTIEQLGTSVTIRATASPNYQPIHITTATAATTYKPNGAVIYAGADGESTRRYWFVNCNETITGVFTNSTGGIATGLINIWSYDENGGAQILTNINTGAVANLGSYNLSVLLSTVLLGTNGVGTYIALEFSSSVAGNWSVSLAVSGASAMIAHKAVPDFNLNTASMGAVRMIGMSQMFSNRASNLQLQGAVSSVQVSSGTCWKSFVSDYTAVQSAQGSYEGAAAKGCYSYLKPIDPSDFEMMDYCSVRNGLVYDSKWPINGRSDFVVTYVRVTNTAGQDALWSYYFNVEYRTSGNTWLTIDDSSMDPNVCSNALNAVKFLDQHFENPLHLASILKRAKELANGAIVGLANAVPKITEGVSKYGPQVLSLAEVLKGLLA